MSREERETIKRAIDAARRDQIRRFEEELGNPDPWGRNSYWREYHAANKDRRNAQRRARNALKKAA